MDFLLDPHIWAGFLALVALEIILGIDNLVFIAILADKLPPAQRDKARIIGLSLALFMRLGLLSILSWLMALTTPLFTILDVELSGRDLILIFGGLFLVYKAVSELHEAIEGKEHGHSNQVAYAGFWVVVSQIVVLDAVFSLDAVITAIGMVDNIYVMMAAVVVAVFVMLIASKPLTKFVNQHPTVVVLCLSFLLMIGFSLIAEGLGVAIPKGYLYAAMGFAIVIEMFNQLSSRNKAKNTARLPRRLRMTESMMRILGATKTTDAKDPTDPLATAPNTIEQERYMIGGVLSLSERTVASIMTPRNQISWLDLNQDTDSIRQVLLSVPHSLFPVSRGNLDQFVTVATAKDILDVLDDPQALQHLVAHSESPKIIYGKMLVLDAIQELRQVKGSLLLVSDEHGAIIGLITPHDVFEAIAGDFPDADESPDLIALGEQRFLATGNADLYQIERQLNVTGLIDDHAKYVTLAGLLSHATGRLPHVGMTAVKAGLHFEIESMKELTIDKVYISRTEEEASKTY